MGHLSNDDCGQLLNTLFHEDLRHVMLAHLSTECNRHDLALDKIRLHCNKMTSLDVMSIAYQDQISKKIFF